MFTVVLALTTPTVRVYETARSVCENLAFYLPRNTNLDQVSPMVCVGGCGLDQVSPMVCVGGCGNTEWV